MKVVKKTWDGRGSRGYLDELKGGDGRQALDVRVVEAAGGVCGVARGQAERHPLGLRGPVGGRERESVVRARVDGVHLRGGNSTYHSTSHIIINGFIIQ